MNEYIWNVKQEIKTQNEREDSKKKMSIFQNMFDVNDYHFKTSKSSNKSIYANSMVSRNQNSTLDTQKLERKKHKYTTKKKSSNHKKKSQKKKKKKKRRKEQRWST